MARNASSTVGWTAALSVAVVVGVFAYCLVWEVITPSALAKNLGYLASLLLAIGVVVMMACLYQRTDEDRKIFGLLALIAAVIYAPFCIGTYFVQLSIVPFAATVADEVLTAITFRPGSLVFALDMLGYAFLCLSTLAAGFVLTSPTDKILRWLCFLHAALAAPTLASVILSGVFLSQSGDANKTGSIVLLFWCVVFMPIALLFMRHFKAQASS